MTNGPGDARPTSVRATAYEQIKADILAFEFRPADRLVEAELCERYEVSRTPVREALRRLEDEKLVVRRERGGRFVRNLDVSAYLDVYGVRRALEMLAIDLVCERPGEADLEPMVDAAELAECATPYSDRSRTLSVAGSPTAT